MPAMGEFRNRKPYGRNAGFRNEITAQVRIASRVCGEEKDGPNCRYEVDSKH